MSSPHAYETRVRLHIEPIIGKNNRKMIPINKSIDGKMLEIDSASDTHYIQIKRWGAGKPRPTPSEWEQFDRTRQQALADNKTFGIALPPHTNQQIKTDLKTVYPGVEIFGIDPF
jgi:hypothetical protein